MKIRNSIFSAISITAMVLGASSCSQEDLVNPAQGDGNVNFTVELESAPAQTRAFGDGKNATSLAYAVYDFDTEELVRQGTGRFSSSTPLSTKISLNLVDGKKYKIAFFAYYSSFSVYGFDAVNKKVTIDYSKMGRIKDFDCFYKMKEIEVDGPVAEQVTLTRPMAQVNWGTNDLNLPAVKNAYKQQYSDEIYICSNIKAQAYNTLNILTGEAEGDLVDVSASSNTSIIDTQYGSFPVDGYDWLKMTYILVPKDPSLMDISLQTFTTSSKSATPIATIDVSNVPVQRNYRTNIYGALLSNKADITVTKEPIFAGYNDREVWDGTVGTIKADADGNYTISTPSELAAIAKMVNGGNALAGKTVTLSRDIDLNNLNWTPIGGLGTSFDGNFEGNGHTIKNLYINQNGKTAAPAGLFGRVWNGTTKISNLKIENVNIDVTGCVGKPEAAAAVLAMGNPGVIENVEVSNVTIKGSHYAGGIAGNVYGSIKNCKATDVDITLGFYQTGSGLDFGDKAGGIFGLHGEGASYEISGNHAQNITIVGYRDLGGCFGMLQDNNCYSNNTADNVTIIGILLDAALVDTAQPGNLGGIVGRKGSNVTDNGGNNATNVNIYTANAPVTDVAKLQTAINNGGFVQITGDITVPNTPVTIDKPTIISVQNGKTLTITNRVYNKSEMTIDGEGTIAGTGTYLINNNADGMLIINNGTISLTATDDNQSPIYNEGSVVVNGGTITNTNGNAMLINWANVPTQDKTIEINGGTFRSNGNYALNIYGAAKPGCKAVIRGGTFVGATAGGRADNGVEVTIEGGTFIGKGQWHGFCAGAESYGSQNCFVTVTGGNFYGTTGNALCQANQATLTVKGGYVNKTTGFTPATGFGLADADTSVTVDGVEYKFTKQIVKQ